MNNDVCLIDKVAVERNDYGDFLEANIDDFIIYVFEKIEETEYHNYYIAVDCPESSYETENSTVFIKCENDTWFYVYRSEKYPTYIETKCKHGYKSWETFSFELLRSLIKLGLNQLIEYDEYRDDEEDDENNNEDIKKVISLSFYAY